MGKLVEKLQQVGQATGGGMGFLGRARTPAQAPRPAAILVSLRAADASAAEAAIKQGADGIIVSGWKSNAEVREIKEAVETGNAVWGVEYAEAKSNGSMLKSAQEAGASFAVVTQAMPATVLFDEVERFDLVIALDAPQDEFGFLLLRAVNLLPAQVGLIQVHFSNSDLTRMTVGDFTRLRLIFESLRFPALVTFSEAPDPTHVRTLVRMGVDGLILPGEGLSGDALGAQVKALREELEKTPIRHEDRSSVMVGGLMEASGTSLPAGPPKREPAPEPDHE